jgi:hypothetical protein
MFTIYLFTIFLRVAGKKTAASNTQQANKQENHEEIQGQKETKETITPRREASRLYASFYLH